MHKELIRQHQKFLIKILPFFAFVGAFMVFVSFYFNDSNEVIIGNVVFTVLSLGIYMIFRTNEDDRYRPKKAYVLIVATLMMAMIWGANVLGYEANSSVATMDYVIAILLGSVIIPLNIKTYLPMLLVTNLYLFLGTPAFSDQDFMSLSVIAIMVFGAVCLVMTHLSYMRMVQNLEATLSLKKQSRGLEVIVKQKSQALKEKEDLLSREVVGVLSTIIEYYDSYTMGHSHNVASLGEKLAARMGYDLEFQQEVYWAGLIHDIGKIRIAKDLLNKPDVLTEDEYHVLQQHSKYGYDMLKKSEALKKIAEIILHHHERYDGTGYPARLKGSEIPIAAQIICLVDAWDAMRSERIYRSALTVQRAREEVKRNRGTQFAPDLVDVFLSLEESHI